MINIRYYYTLNELFEGDFNLDTLNVFFETSTQSQTTLDIKFNDVVNNLFDGYADWYIGFIDKYIRCYEDSVEPTEEEKEIIKNKFLRKFSITYNYTSDRYLTLLNLYTSQKNNLMSKLSNTSSNSTTHRVNDTPQNGGNFYDDEHTSVYEQTTISTNNAIDPTTVMSRLDEIQDKYANVIKDWVEEFNSLFIPPYNEWSCNE